jgi:predicted HAD superfamily hydrolase
MVSWKNMLTRQRHASVADPSETVDAYLKDGCRVVTFDVFDTLLWRETLRPHEAFMFIGLEHGWIHGRLRAPLELAANLFCRRALKREPTLRDIYRLSPLKPDHELRIEKRLCTPNPFCLALVNRLLDDGVPVAAISDMYLETGQIAELLQAAGYPSLPLYSSATEQLTKYRDGRLFNVAWNHLGKPPEEVVHVGDNPHADIAMASSLGAKTCRVSTPRETLFQLCPSANRPIRDPSESLFMGRIAITLQIHVGNDDRRREAARAVLRKAFPTGDPLRFQADLIEELIDALPSLTLTAVEGDR